jgi:hypothetical protein
MKKDVSGPAMSALLVVVVVVVISLGWYFINRPSPTVADTSAGMQKNGARGARTMGGAAPATTMPGPR